MAIKILIDSASDINQEDAKKLGVDIIPLIVGFGDEEYLDGVDLSSKEFFEKLMTDKNHPKTSQITPYRFSERFKQLTENGDQVVCICISSKLSGTFESARQAALDYKDKVFVVDSMSATVGERILCEYALKLIEKGLPAKEIKEELDRAKKHVYVTGLLDTLEFLKRGGRVSKTVEIVGGALNIKPVFAIIDGEVKMVGKAIGRRRGCSLMNSVIEQKGGVNFDMPHYVLYSGLDEEIALKYIKDSKNLLGERTSIPYNAIGSTIGTHVGPGVVGIAFFEK